MPSLDDFDEAEIERRLQQVIAEVAPPPGVPWTAEDRKRFDGRLREFVFAEISSMGIAGGLLDFVVGALTRETEQGRSKGPA